MQQLTVRSQFGDYEVVADRGAVLRLGDVLDERSVERPRVVVTNTVVEPLWGSPAAEALETDVIALADGEAAKRWPAVETLFDGWLERRIHRGQSVAAVGGGVLTDTAGFAAAAYLRGINWVVVPTTLLAMVDASVGGKTGINLDQGKNLVGAFWPPRLVVIDVDTLTTLPERELRAGVAEAIKTAWIGDHDLLSEIPSRFDGIGGDLWQEIVMRCVAVKARVVSQDERESGKRAALNLGHTLGHALEAATGYGHFLHGEAVAWGLLAAANLGHRRGVLSDDGHARLTTAVAGLGPLPAIDSVAADDLRSHIGRDKKMDDAGVQWVLPTDNGVVLAQRVATDEAIEVFRALQADTK